MKGVRIFFLLLGLAVSAMAAESLPKVLIICESVHLRNAQTAATELKGRADVVVPPPNLGDTASALAKLDELLGETKWDLIHFNFGFSDLRHVDPRTKSVRAMSRHAGGVRVSSPEQYEANLKKIVTRLKETGAQLVWASSTPIVGTKYDHLYESGSEDAYNAAALKIMREEKIPVNDLHAWILGNVKKFTDSFAFNKIPMHEPIVKSIEKALDLPDSAEAN